MFGSLIESFRANLGLTLLSILIFGFLVIMFLLDPDSKGLWSKAPASPAAADSAEKSDSKRPETLDLSEVGDYFSLWEDAKFGLGTDTVVIRNKAAEKTKAIK